MNTTTGYALVGMGVVVVAIGVVGLVASGDGEPVPGGPTGPATSATGATASVTGTTGTTGATGATGVQIETPEGFLPVFSQAIREGDAGFLFARLHPVVTAFYGEGQCRATMRAFQDPTADFVFLSSREPGTYQWSVDGVTTPVEDVLTVRVEIATADGPARRAIHLGIVGTELRWFTDCGEPA